MRFDRHLKRAALLLLAATAAPAAFAQLTTGDGGYDYGEVTLPDKADKAIVGGGLAVGRRYMGSDERRTSVLPIFDYRWANGWFAGLSNGVGYNFSTERGLSYGLRLTADFGRKESRSAALAGMGDISAKPEIGAFYSQSLGSGLSVHASIRYGAVGTGLLVDGGVGWSLPLASATRLKLGAALTVANSDYMQDYFGVTPEQSASSGYQVFNAKAGVRDVRLSAAVVHSFSPQLHMTGGITVRSLQGDAADSPLTREKTSPSAMLGVIYIF